ncbi:kinetochore-associated protein 1 [Planococcus citri]|uniref:kinetochore-associated protein 1 n=1 Tax=Planococcus citri TaxID=170843 RepID=UPI0031F799C9
MWDKITLGFDAEEETVNFGCRKMAVCNSAVYETNTLAIFSNEEENAGDKIPQVTCTRYSGSDSGIIVSINETLATFNSSGDEMKNKYTFNSTIDCFVVTSSGSLAFIALSNGDLHCLILTSNRNPVFLRNIVGQLNERTFTNIFIRENDTCCDLILTSSGRNIYKIKNLNIAELVQIFISQTPENIVKLTDTLVVEETPLHDAYEKIQIILSYEYYKFTERRLLIICEYDTRQELLVWSEDNDLLHSLFLPPECKLKKLQMNKDAKLIYGLTHNGSLLIICAETFQPILHQQNLSISDFEIVNEEDDSLLVLRNDSHLLQLLSMPGFQPKFQLEVNPVSFLARNQSSLDDLLYLEGQKKDAETLGSIHLKLVSESQPEYRLERILRRGKFEEAEEFARSFNLDIEIVYKAHLKTLSNDIQPWSSGKVSLEESSAKFKDLLKKVKDIEFVAQCAVNAISSDYSLMKEILNYAENRIRIHLRDKREKPTKTLQDLYNQIRNVLLRLNTFLAISDQNFSAEKWLSFYKVNLIEECQSLLKQECLNQVILIWSRHVHQLRDKLAYDQAMYFLKAIPSSTNIKDVLRWLRIFLSDCFVLFPKMLRNVVNWCKEKVNMMELRGGQEWPESGVTFLKELLKIVRQNVLSCKISSENIIQSEFGNESPIKEILSYIKILSEITIIKKNHCVLVTIAEYTQDNDKEIIFTILDKIPLEELNSFVNGFLAKLMLEKNLHGDVIISEYIQCLVEGSVNWWYWEEAPWEGRVAVLINCISSIEEKLKCVLCVLKYSPVPWSSIVSNICDEALKYKSPLTKLINEQKKLVNCKLILKKYDLKDNVLTKSHVNRIILFIFSQARDSMLDDALQIANTFDFEMCTEVYKLFVQYLIEKGEFNQLQAFLDDDSISLKIVVKCCEKIILRAHCLSKAKCFRDEYENYMEIIDSADAKLLRALQKLQANGEPIKSVITAGVCKQLKCVHYLNTHYDWGNVGNNFKLSQQNNILEYCLKSLLTNMSREPKSVEKEALKLAELSSYFEYTKEEIYIKFITLATQQNDTCVAMHLSRWLLKENEFTANIAKQLINLASIILQHCIESTEKPSNNVAFVIHQLIVSGLNTCPPEWLSQGLEISNWCKLTRPSQNEFTSESAPDTLNYTHSMSFTSTKALLTVYNVFLSENNMKSAFGSSVESSINQTTAPDQIYQMTDLLQNLVKNEQEQVSMQAITTLHWSLLHHCFLSSQPMAEVSLVSQTKMLTAQCISKLLKKLIGSRHLDCQLGLALLHYFPVEEASNWIMESTKKFRHDFQRLYSITELGMVYFHKNKCTEHWNIIYKLRKQCVWGKQIMEYGFSYKEAFRDNPQDRCQLLRKLMSVPSMTTATLTKYCNDVNFDLQSCLKFYLKHVLLSWEPEFEVKVDAVTGEKTLFIKPTQAKLLQKCREICSLIENTNEMYQLIAVNVCNSVNYYYYEVFMTLIILLEEMGMKQDSKLFSIYRTIFLFLNSYQRISKPQEFEKEQWYQMYPNEQSLPAISEYRLPFKLLYSKFCKGDPWKIIQHELNINTYTKWFTVLDALELDKNVLCSLAINQITSDGLIEQEMTKEWCTHLKNQKLLADVKACVDNITNLEMSCASLYHVVNHLPPGADQLAAAKLCHGYAKQWRETEKSDKSEAGFQKVLKKYLTISTTHILYIHNLRKPQYLQLVLKPYELLIAIYGDPVILQKNTGNVIMFPDINKAAEEISQMHKIDVMKVRMELLEEWLQPENFIANVSCDETMIKQHQGDSVVEAKFSDVEYQNFQRACYVIERDIVSFGKYLVGIVFDQNSDDSKPVSVRLRALQCLYAVCSPDILEQITERSLDKLRDLLNTLKFVMELEVLGLTYSVPMFESCDKPEIARSLLTLKNPKAIRLAAHLCRHFNIDQSAIWNLILSKMCDYEMVKELAQVLPDLSDNYHTLDLTVFEKSWNTVLKLPLEKAPAFLSAEDTEMIERSVELIYFCPIIDQIDVESIKKQCLKINRSDLADNICTVNL